MLFSRCSPNKEIAGLRFEIIGLTFILAAAIWQAGFTDWMEKINSEWQNQIQEEVNVAILENLNDLAGMSLRQKNDDVLHKYWDEVSDRSGKAIVQAIRQRDQRSALQRNQAAVFRIIRLAMAIAGAILIIIGKYLVFVHKADTALKNSAAT